MRRWPLGVICALVLVATSCSIGNDDAPRDIPPAGRRDLGSNTEQPAGAATGTARIYLLSPEVAGQARTLQPVARDVAESPAGVLRALLEGPNSSELDNQLRTALPTDTRLLGTEMLGDVLLVDVSNELRQLSGEVLIDAVGQIVLTATELRGINGVRISIEGSAQQWPAGSGELQSEALTRFDYPGLVLSTQPEYPAIPSPSRP